MVVGPAPARTYRVRYEEIEERWVVVGDRDERYAIHDDMVAAITDARAMARDNPPSLVVFEDVLGEVHELASYDARPPGVRR